MPSEEQGANEQEAYNKFRLQQFSLSDQVSVRCDAEGLGPRLRVAPAVNEMGRKGFLYEIEFDLSSVPEGQDFDIGFELTDVGLQGRLGDANHFDFAIIAPTDVATMWVFLPVGRPYQSFKVIAYDSKAPVNVESIDPTYDFQMADGSLFGWMLVCLAMDIRMRVVGTTETNWQPGRHRYLSVTALSFSQCLIDR